MSIYYIVSHDSLTSKYFASEVSGCDIYGKTDATKYTHEIIILIPVVGVWVIAMNYQHAHSFLKISAWNIGLWIQLRTLYSKLAALMIQSSNNVVFRSANHQCNFWVLTIITNCCYCHAFTGMLMLGGIFISYMYNFWDSLSKFQLSIKRNFIGSDSRLKRRNFIN